MSEATRYNENKPDTVEIHSIIDNLNEIGWWLVKFPDKGAGATRCYAYVQGDSEENVREICSRHPHFNAYDTSKGTVNHVGNSFGDIENGLLRGGPNAMIGQDGDVQRRSDVFDV